MMRLRWVKARIDEGMQTGQAIRCYNTTNAKANCPKRRRFRRC
jgi:hypothetical protein